MNNPLYARQWSIENTGSALQYNGKPDADMSVDDAWLITTGDVSIKIAVDATSMCDERKNPSDCSGENWGGTYGAGLDVSAPGVKISTSDMTGSNGFTAGNYTYTFNGTSAACPNATGVRALVLSVNPLFSGEDVRTIINQSADRVPGYVYDSTSVYGTWNTEMGHGRVNANAAVILAQTFVPSSGVDELILLNVQMYPNPTNGILHFASDHSIVKAEVFDLFGRRLKEKDGNNIEMINASELENGEYLIRLSSEDHVKVLRFVKVD